MEIDSIGVHDAASYSEGEMSEFQDDAARMLDEYDVDGNGALEGAEIVSLISGVLLPAFSRMLGSALRPLELTLSRAAVT